MSETSTTRSGIIVSIIFAVSAVLGFGREIVLAAYFGASAQMDALLVAMVIPSFFLNMLGEASMGAAVVPIFITYVMPKSTKEQRQIVGSGFTLLSLLMAAVCAIGIVFAVPIAKLLAPGFSAEQTRLTAQLMMIMLPSVIFLGLSNLVTGLLHSFSKFGVAAMTGVMFNLAIVVATIPLAKTFGIYAPAIGTLVGTIVQLAIMLPSLAKTGLFGAIGFTWRSEEILLTWRLLWPLLLGGLMVTGLKTVDKIVASFMPSGSISALNYASKLAGGPSRIFAMSVSVVLFPALVKKVAEGSENRGDLVIRGLNIAAFLTLPWAGLLIALRTPIVYVLFQRGAFDARATMLVALPLAIYCLGEFADGISTMVNNAFYSHQDSKIPTYIYVGSNVFRIFAILALVPVAGYLAIAIGNVLAVDGALLLLLVLLRRHVPDLNLRKLGIDLGKIVVSSAACGVVAWMAYLVVSQFTGHSQLQTLLAIGIASLPGLVAYYVVARLIGSPEAEEFKERVAGLLRRKRPEPEPAPAPVEPQSAPSDA